LYCIVIHFFEFEIMIQKPPSFILLSAFATAVTLSIIALGITGALCSPGGWGYCSFPGTIAAGPAIGIIASLFCALFSGLGISWLIFVLLWKTRVVFFVLLGGFSGVALFAMISAIILAYTANNVGVGASYGTAGAGSAFEFFLMLGSIAIVVLMIMMDKNFFGMNPTSDTYPEAPSNTGTATTESVPPPV